MHIVSAHVSPTLAPRAREIADDPGHQLAIDPAVMSRPDWPALTLGRDLILHTPGSSLGPGPSPGQLQELFAKIEKDVWPYIKDSASRDSHGVAAIEVVFAGMAFWDRLTAEDGEGKPPIWVPIADAGLKLYDLASSYYPKLHATDSLTGILGLIVKGINDTYVIRSTQET